MLHHSLKKLVVALVAAALLFSAPAKAELTKEQVEQIVHDYIANNAEVILKSVDDYQRTGIAKRRAEALKSNSEALFNDDKSPFIGDAKGDVVLVEFFDYNCHYCKQIFKDLRDLSEKDKKLKIIFKDLPILGPMSESSSKWALAAHLQGKYFEYHQKLMEHKGPIKDGDLEKYGEDIGLDVARAKREMDGTEVLIQIERNRALAGQMNFNGTPSFVINDEAFSGVPDKKELEKKIARAREGKSGEKKKKAE